MKFDEARKLENFKAHYEIIMGNITIANKEYQDILNKTEQANTNLEEINKQLSNAKEELILVQQKHAQSHIDSALAIQKASDATIELESKKQEVYDHNLKESQAMADERSLHSVLIETTANNLLELREREITLTESVDNLTQQESEKMFAVSALDEEVSSLSRQKAELIQSIDEFNTSHRVNINNANAELSQIKDQIESSRSMIINTDNYFADREAQVTRREQDSTIIINRLKKSFKDYYPDLTLPIN